MKKFSKILTLLLALVVIVTAFTVITLAAEKPEAPSFSGTNNASSIDFTFDSHTVGAIRAYGSTKRGVMFYDATVDGNKYFSAEYVYNDSESVRDGQTTDIYSTKDYSTYSLDNYPVMSFDFDVMSELGVLPTNNTSCATYFSFFVSKSGTKGPSFTRIEFANLGLAKKAPYEWRLHITTGNDYIGFIRYCYYKGFLCFTVLFADSAVVIVGICLIIRNNENTVCVCISDSLVSVFILNVNLEVFLRLLCCSVCRSNRCRLCKIKKSAVCEFNRNVIIYINGKL